MTWHILMKDDDGNRYASSTLDSREKALSFACDLLNDYSLQIVRIENIYGETIDLGEVALWVGAAVQRKTRRQD